MRVLLIGNGTFFHLGAFFSRALAARGDDHVLLDISRYELRPGRPSPVRAAARLSGYRHWLRWRLNRAAVALARSFRPDVVLATGGGFMLPGALRRLRSDTRAVLVTYAADDPFNPLHRTRRFVAGIPLWDVYASPRRPLIADLERHGARRTAFVRFAYEPVLHHPEEPATAAERAAFASGVMFAGGADPDRYPLLRAVRAVPGADLRLYGGFWERDPELRGLARGFAYDRTYRLAIGGSKIALALVRHANRDRHAMRTFEIAACGGFILADRTEEHLEMLEEDREAAFFSSPEELADKVRYWLPREEERRAVAAAGRRRITGGGHTWADRVNELLALAAESR